MRRLGETKEQLDRQTSYLTFLPHMDEGFHTGYHTVPGVVSDHSSRPGEWLESLARNMHTNGQEVGYSIPDVLACEQQLRRLSRLDAAEMRSNQQMTDYRAVLALLLLWDSWQKQPDWPVLEMQCLSGDQTSFSASVTAALTPKRAPDGLWVFTLRSARDTEAAVCPIALLSNAMVIIPAANPGDLGSLLPPCVSWYDRSHKCFTDPCTSISQRDAFVLISRLRVLQALKEQPEWQSPLLNADEQLVSLLGRFADDLLRIHSEWQNRLIQGDPASLQSMRLYLLAAFSQETILPVEKQVLRPYELPLIQNPLLKAFSAGELPACPSDELIIWRLNEQDLACQSNETLIKPAVQQNQEALLSCLENELALLEAHDTNWREHVTRELRIKAAESENRTGLLPMVIPCLHQWSDELEAIPSSAGCEITLDYPLGDCPVALQALMQDALGLPQSILCDIFSDALLIFEHEAEEANRLFRVEELGYAVPPLSPALCSWLMDSFDQSQLNAPKLDSNSFCFEKTDDQITVSFTIRKTSADSATSCANAVTFRRSYRLCQRTRFDTGYAVVLPAYQRPGVTVWPNARFAPDLWKNYYVFTQQPGAVSAWVCGTDGWKQGLWHTTPADSWQTACTDRFPAFVAFKRGELTMGALINDIPRRLIKHEPPAAAAIDFGSISTTVMMRQGDRIQPASLPECMHQTLLKSGRESDLMTNAFLPEDALLPGSSSETTCYSLMDMFSDDMTKWNVVLRDGHIYYRSSLEALTRKDASALYYDLKWGEENYAQRVMRLFLKQIMLQSSLAARLWGSPSISYRVSMPNAMPLHKQEAYLELTRGLAREVAHETGMPLTSGCPSVLYATENQADGLYFLSRSEINAQSGYLNLDIGGSTTDLSLWLGGARYAAIESSLLMGCRQMLFTSLLERHAEELDHDFDGMDETLETAIHQVTDAFRREGTTTRGQRKCMLLLDDLLATQAESIRRCMAQSRAKGQISYLEALLLWQTGYLFYLAGEMLERAWHDGFMRMQLPERMELCIAGNGGQLLKAFSDEQRTRLCSLALARLGKEHPLQVLLPIQSRHPKQEAARGLLYDDRCLQSAISSAERYPATAPEKRENMLLHYLPLFYHVFPQAAQRLMPNAFEEYNGAIAIRATARMELDTIYANELLRDSGDDFASCVSCFMALKRLWNI